jgi:HD-like signal output (HDOD) protein
MCAAVATGRGTNGDQPGGAPARLDARTLLLQEVQAKVEGGTYRVPLLPQVATQVVALSTQDDVDASKLSALIHRDPSLAGQVLRVANSAAYSPRMPIVSLQQAVARLGLTVINEIAFATSLQSGTFQVAGHERDLKDLWQHALAAGAWGKEVARHRRTNVESAFLCGLLHGVGRPALLQVAVDIARHLNLRLDRDWLPEIFAAHEPAVGARLAEAWALPGMVAAAILHHRQYAGAGKFTQEAMTTHLASKLATWSLDPDTEGDEESAAILRSAPVLAELNIYPDDLDALAAKRDVVRAVVDALTV